ncbi:hypothetical protein BaRGS_00007862 [Batillaria attramentaria]|uniref:Uncharacterized protein n=1 Tax=Batillaria attramentaria TaxID=370345 RepID=A0ABD0LPI7_9CAEN
MTSRWQAQEAVSVVSLLGVEIHIRPEFQFFKFSLHAKTTQDHGMSICSAGAFMGYTGNDTDDGFSSQQQINHRHHSPLMTT